MHTYANRILTLLILVFLVTQIEAAKPLLEFDGETTEGIPVEFMRFQAREKEPDYGENWYFSAQQKDGSCLFASLTVSNVALNTYDSYVNVAFKPAGGSLIKIHKEYPRAQLEASTEVYDVKIGSNRAWGAAPDYHLQIEEGDFKADLLFRSELPAYRYRDGVVRIGGKEYAYGINAPSAHATGTVSVGENTYAVDGKGFHDHGWQTLKVTEFSKGGLFLKIWHDDLTIILQDLYLKDGYGQKKVQNGLIGKGGKILASSDNYSLETTKTQKDKESGYEWPKTITVDFDSNGVKVTGTVRTVATIQRMDMLAELKWPIQVFIRTFVSNPWLYRLRGRYDLNVTINGETQHITGETMPGLLYY